MSYAATANEAFGNSYEGTSDYGASRYAAQVEGKRADAHVVETVRGEWQKELKHTMGGLGEKLHTGANWFQRAALGAMVGGSWTLAIPLVGELFEGSAAVAYGLGSAFKGALRTLAENRALKKAGISKEQQGGIGRGIVNSIHELLPW